MRSLCCILLVVLSGQCFAAQSIVPNPRAGTVLWKRTVQYLEPGYPALLGADGALWAATQRSGAVPIVATAFDPKTGGTLSNAVPTFSFPEMRLKDGAAFLLDGTAVAKSGGAYSGTVSAVGNHQWTTVSFWRPEFGVAAAAGVYIFRHSPSAGDGTTIIEEHLAALEGATGGTVYDRRLSGPAGALCGFAAGGRVLMIHEGSVAGQWLLSGLDAGTGTRLFSKTFPKGAIPDEYTYTTISPTRFRMVTTEAGLIAIAVISNGAAGVLVMDPANGTSSKLVMLGGDPTRVTGLVAARNGLLYASIAATIPKPPWPAATTGGIRGIDPATGQVVVIPDISDAILGAPAIGTDGTLFAIGTANVGLEVNVTLYAVATGSVGGLARSAWPRSTGDNLNSFREQGVEDSDGDGLTDEEENFTYHTNPTLADTDGDGYSDGVEVQYGSDPKNKLNIPEILEAQVAIKLTFGTNLNQRYRLQSSADLATWADEGTWFDGTGAKSTQLVEALKSRFYWRLVRLQ